MCGKLVNTLDTHWLSFSMLSIWGLLSVPIVIMVANNLAFTHSPKGEEFDNDSKPIDRDNKDHNDNSSPGKTAPNKVVASEELFTPMMNYPTSPLDPEPKIRSFRASMIPPNMMNELSGRLKIRASQQNILSDSPLSAVRLLESPIPPTTGTSDTAQEQMGPSYVGMMDDYGSDSDGEIEVENSLEGLTASRDVVKVRKNIIPGPPPKSAHSNSRINYSKGSSEIPREFSDLQDLIDDRNQEIGVMAITEIPEARADEILLGVSGNMIWSASGDVYQSDNSLPLESVENVKDYDIECEAISNEFLNGEHSASNIATESEPVVPFPTSTNRKEVTERPQSALLSHLPDTRNEMPVRVLNVKETIKFMESKFALSAYPTNTTVAKSLSGQSPLSSYNSEDKSTNEGKGDSPLRRQDAEVAASVELRTITRNSLRNPDAPDEHSSDEDSDGDLL